MSTAALPAQALAAVRAAVAAVTDPEYPDLTIEQLGILERVVDDGAGGVVVELVPTVTSCPALGMIERDVVSAAQQALGASASRGTEARVAVRFLHEPTWTPARVAASARQFLAREYTVAVRTRASRAPDCPRCGASELRLVSAFGATRCRSVYRCGACGEHVEVVGDFAVLNEPASVR